MAREATVLADVTKFDLAATGFMFDLSEVGTIVTNDYIRAPMREALEAAGVRIVVDREEGRR